MDFCVQLSFDNINTPELAGYGVDHVKVAEGLGCKALRVFEPDGILPALEEAKKLMVEHRVPIVVEVILERITNVAMGTEIDNVVEFDELDDVRQSDADRLRPSGLREVITMRVAVLGAGAIGAYVGAALHRGGTEVHLVARGAHLEAIRKNGVQVLQPARRLAGPDAGHRRPGRDRAGRLRLPRPEGQLLCVGRPADRAAAARRRRP